MSERKLTPNEEKGLDLLIRTAKKKYPFIKGWSPSPYFTNYKTTNEIKVAVDFTEINKFYGFETTEYYESRIKVKGDDVNSLLYFVDWGRYGSEQFDKMSDLSHEKTREVVGYLEKLYSNLPEEFRVQWGYSSYRELSVNSFYQYNLIQ